MAQVLGALQGYDAEGRPKKPVTRIGITAMAASAMTRYGEVIVYLAPDGEFEFVVRSTRGEEVYRVHKNMHKMLERRGLLRADD